MDEKQLELQARVTALQLAIQVVGATPEQVAQYAQTFYEFLKGAK
jgi:hypothetical protein